MNKYTDFKAKICFASYKGKHASSQTDEALNLFNAYGCAAVLYKQTHKATALRLETALLTAFKELTAQEQEPTEKYYGLTIDKATISTNIDNQMHQIGQFLQRLPFSKYRPLIEKFWTLESSFHFNLQEVTI